MYKTFLAVHTNQKRFQCERPKEKRAVLRERKRHLAHHSTYLLRIGYFTSLNSRHMNLPPGRRTR